jgi:hypothetical protein
MSENQAAEIERALATHTQDERVNALLDICVGRVLRKVAKRGTDWTAEYKPEAVDHIVEWLSMSCAEDAHWLDNKTPDGKPKKLLKFSTVQDVVREADEYFRKKTANAAKLAVAEDSPDEKSVYSLQEGYRIVKLLSSTALDREGSLMGHCVGAGGYDNSLKSGRAVFFSLRDPRNRPHVTMEVRVADKKVLQARGKQNAYPIQKYAKMIEAFSNQEGYDLSGEKVGLAELRTPDGHILDPDNLPEDRVVIAGNHGGWQTLALDNQGIERWPRIVEVEGDVSMDFLANDGPEEIIVRGRLRIGRIERGARLRRILATNLSVGTEVASLPEDTTVTDGLGAIGSALERLPANLNLVGTLDIRKTKIRTLPARFSCRDLMASESDLISIPDGLVVPGVVDISKTKVATLPDGFSCNSLLAAGSGLATLPATLSVQRNLDICDTRVTTIPVGVSCGNLLAARSGLSSLPEGFSVEGTIDIRDTDVTTLPENLHCFDLLIQGSKVVSVGKGTVIKGDIQASSTKLRLLPKGLSVVGSLMLNDTAVRVLPRNLSCGNLYIARTRVTCIPASLSVYGSLIATDSSLRTLGDHEEFETLDISGCPIKRMPDHLLVHGKLDASRLPHPVSLAGIVGGNEIHANGTTITAFPERLALRDGLYLKGATLAAVPDTLICSELQLDGARIDELPRNLTVRKWLSVAGSSLRRIHDLSNVSGIIDLTGSQIEALPDGLTIQGSLWIENSAIRHLPAGLRIGDDLRAGGSKLESLGQDIVIGRSADFTRTLITEEMIWDARMIVKNVFDFRGGWVSGWEPMEERQNNPSSWIAHIVARISWVIKRTSGRGTR